MVTTTIQENIDLIQKVNLKHTSIDPNPDSRQQEIINNLLLLAQKEQQKGNTSITSDKLDKLTSLLAQQQQQQQQKLQSRSQPLSIPTKAKLPQNQNTLQYLINLILINHLTTIDKNEVNLQ